MKSLGVFGPMGSGKSLIASVLARRLIQFDKSIDIYTNMNVSGSNFKLLRDLGELPFKDGKSKIVILDEAYFSLDSRNTSSKNNRIWSKAFVLFRKSDVILTIFITHRPRMLDVNIREQLDLVCMCRKNPNYFDYLFMDTITEELSSIKLIKSQQLFDFANFDTKDFPLPITVDKLITNPLFSIAK